MMLRRSRPKWFFVFSGRRKKKKPEREEEHFKAINIEISDMQNAHLSIDSSVQRKGLLALSNHLARWLF